MYTTIFKSLGGNYPGLGQSQRSGSDCKWERGNGVCCNGSRDSQGNIIAGNVSLSPEVNVTNSVLIGDVTITGKGDIRNSVLIGTRAKNIQAEGGLDFHSTVVDLTLESRAATYKVVSKAPVHAEAGRSIDSTTPAARASPHRIPARRVHLCSPGTP